MPIYHSKPNIFYGLKEWISFGLLAILFLLVSFLVYPNLFFVLTLGFWFAGLTSYKIRKILNNKIIYINVDINDLKIFTKSKEYIYPYSNLKIYAFSNLLIIDNMDKQIKIHRLEWDTFTKITDTLQSKISFSKMPERKTNTIMDLLNVLIPWNN